MEVAIEAAGELTERRVQDLREVDVAIVGAGLSGVTAAAVLGRAGYRIALVDRHAVCPAQFRAEKIDPDQADLFRRLGLLDRIAAAGTQVDQFVNIRRGRVIDRTRTRHYSLRYEEMVNAVQADLPENVERFVDRVVDISTDAELQRVMLAKQGTIEARLIVLATGMGDFLHDKLGMTRRVASENHSISFGFELTPASGRKSDFPAVTYYGESIEDRVAYLSIFPLKNIFRANLFSYRAPGDPWVGDLLRSPKQTLLTALPGLKAAVGDFEIVGRVEIGVMHLCQIEGQHKDGVVLVGDVFQTSCPAAGTGVTRLLTDVERLCLHHVPNWLASPGMGREKIAKFYQDPVKQTTDAWASAAARNHRALAVDARPIGIARRLKHFQKRRLKEWIRGAALSHGATSAKF